ncbi:hypothetical protein JTE90_004238 [Oedothorax gibbosus]|uniref:Prothoracicostatic peptide n=1 Tax=Oedothorax gibbosus TaxID=931172 RepID=A0AAV6UP73_9ARAC|nr:hypothetical protein JTE90_004238 [Oedothorax gibbosus]
MYKNRVGPTSGSKEGLKTLFFLRTTTCIGHPLLQTIDWRALAVLRKVLGEQKRQPSQKSEYKKGGFPRLNSLHLPTSQPLRIFATLSQGKSLLDKKIVFRTTMFSPKMHRISLTLLCILPLIYFASCNPGLPDVPPKPEANPHAIDLENLHGQLDTSLVSEEEDDPEKRGWERLSNVWGKRADWNKLNNMWGKRGDWNKLNNMWGKRAAEWNKLNNMWGKRGDGNWNKLNNMWGKRGDGDWNKLNNMWGKRGDGDWNKLNNMWGKRAAEWNKLNNMWGKRAEWNKLNNMWGKRGSSREDGSKRTQWNNLKSVWGKRDAGWEGPVAWDTNEPNEDSFQGVYVPDQM